MSRPHPVVGLAAELAHRGRRSTNEAHVAVDLVYYKVIYILVVEAGDADIAVRVVCLGGLDEPLPGRLHGIVGEGIDIGTVLILLQRSLPGLLENRGDVCHALEELYRETLDGEFIPAAHGPVSVLEIVVLRGAEALDAAVAAMVVGHEQSPVGNDFARAASAELDDGVLQ